MPKLPVAKRCGSRRPSLEVSCARVDLRGRGPSHGSVRRSPAKCLEDFASMADIEFLLIDKKNLGAGVQEGAALQRSLLRAEPRLGYLRQVHHHEWPDTRSVSIMGQTPSARCSSMRPTAGKSHRHLGLRTRPRRRYPRPRPQSRARSILPIMSRRGNHDQTGPRRRGKIRARFRAGTGGGHRRGHHGLDALPVDADGQPLAFRKNFAENPARARLAVEGVTPVSRKRKKSLRWRGRFVRNTWPNAAASIPASGSSARSCTVCARRRGVRRGLYLDRAADFVPAALTGTLAPGRMTAGILRRRA